MANLLNKISTSGYFDNVSKGLVTHYGSLERKIELFLVLGYRTTFQSVIRSPR